jgi:hypothetical protein
MTRWWSERVDGKKIFFKFPEHFQAHFKTWNALRVELTTMQLTENDRAEFMDIMRSNAHASLVLDESFSPVVQGRKAVASAAKIAVRNRQIRDISEQNAPEASTSKTIPSRLPPPHRITQPPPVSMEFRIAMPQPMTTVMAASTGTGSGKQPKARKTCAVCKSAGDYRRAPDCPGSGKRLLCPHYQEPGTVGPTRVVHG